MFTGIVAEVGTVEEIHAGTLRVRGGAALANLRVGASVAVNGVCLTAKAVGDGEFSADVMAETLHRTALGQLATGAPVNIEPALAIGDEVGGHFVQGHIDGVGVVAATRDDGNARWVEIDVPDAVRPYCVFKGSIAVDGTSLTIAGVEGQRISVSLVPHTLSATIAGAYRPGTPVNLEADILAKYVARYVAEHGIAPTGPTGDPGGHPKEEG